MHYGAVTLNSAFCSFRRRFSRFCPRPPLNARHSPVVFDALSRSTQKCLCTFFLFLFALAMQPPVVTGSAAAAPRLYPLVGSHGQPEGAYPAPPSVSISRHPVLTGTPDRHQCPPLLLFLIPRRGHTPSRPRRPTSPLSPRRHHRWSSLPATSRTCHTYGCCSKRARARRVCMRDSMPGVRCHRMCKV